MKRMLVAMVIATSLVTGALAGAVPQASAEVSWTKYNLKVGKVAKKMDCKHLRKRTGPSKLTLSTGQCDLLGTAVNVYTFKSKRKQNAWVRKIRLQGATNQGAQYMAVATGVVVAAKHWRPAGVEAAVQVLDCEVIAF